MADSETAGNVRRTPGDTSWSGCIVPLAWAQTFVAIADTPSRIDYATPDRVLRAQRSIGRRHAGKVTRPSGRRYDDIET